MISLFMFYYITVSVDSFTITVLKIFEALKDFLLSRHHFVIEMAELFLGIYKSGIAVAMYFY